MVTTVYIVRHCQSMGNIQRRFQGQYDAPVSEAGEKQLELLGLRFRNEHLDAVYTSPLIRARRTAEAIAKYHGLEPIVEPGFIEIDCGEMENLPLSEVSVRFPEVAKNWDESPDLCRFPGGETMREVYERVNAALDRVIAGNPGRRIVITTHGGVIRNLCARISFGELKGIRQSEVFGNTGVSTLLAEDGELRWAEINNLQHLPEELRRPPTKYRFSPGGEPI